MSANEYYERLTRLLSASPPSGGAKKSSASGGKKSGPKARKAAPSKKAATKTAAAKKSAPAKAAAKKAATETKAAKAPSTASSKTNTSKLKSKPASGKTVSARNDPAPKTKSSSAKSAKAKQAKSSRSGTISRDKLIEGKRSSVQRVLIERTLNRGLENMKQHVEAAKFSTPPQVHREEPEIIDLPDTYGRCKIVCLVRDPYWIHTYWEITEERLREAEEFFGSEWGQTRTVLRVHDVTSDDNIDSRANGHFDVELSGNAVSWYINVNSPNTAFIVDIVRVSPSGKEFILARSNAVMTPRDGMSDILDEEWMSLDFEKMYALSGGFRIGSSSMEMHEMMKERLKSEISSWGGSEYVSSFGGSPVAKQRSFWFVLDCELIVYGATEPDAKVTMQGRPVKLRPDGTFTVRFALPDGVQKIDTTAVSADGVEERTITPTVSRSTKSSEKILKEF